MGFTSAGRDQGSQFFFELPLHSAASAGIDGRVSSANNANANLNVNVMRVQGPERKRRRRKPAPAPSSPSILEVVGVVSGKVYAATMELEQDDVVETEAFSSGQRNGSSRDCSEGNNDTIQCGSGSGSRSGNRSPLLPLEDMPRMAMDLESESDQLIAPPPRPLSTFLVKAEQYSQLPSCDSPMDNAGTAAHCLYVYACLYVNVNVIALEKQTSPACTPT